MGIYEATGKQILFHDDNDVVGVHIADAADPEKAHFLCMAANLFSTIEAIGGWAEARDLVRGSTPQAQTVKLGEEFGELCGGIARKKLDVVEDSIGDVVVVLIIIALQTNMSFAGAVQAAYNTIKDRKGKMVDGVFVKDAE